MRIAETAVDKGIDRPTRPVVAGGENSVKGSPFAMLNNVGEPLIPLATITPSLEVVFDFRRLRVFGPSSHVHWSDCYGKR